jgi:hypothetical protein
MSRKHKGARNFERGQGEIARAATKKRAERAASTKKPTQAADVAVATTDAAKEAARPNAYLRMLARIDADNRKAGR